MSDLPGGDAAHEVVTAVLAVTPTWDDEVIVDTEVTDTTTWRAPGETPELGIPDTFTTPVFGDPAPIAARQAAAVLRWAANRIQHPNSHGEVNCAAENLRTQADRIDPPEETDDQR